MIRRSSLVGLTSALLLAASGAQAVGISIVGVSSSGGNTALLSAGDVLTVDLLLENPGNLNIYGLGIDVRGYDSDANGRADNGLSLLGGTLGAMAFAESVDQGESIGGLDNVHVAPVQRGNPASGNGTLAVPARELHAVLFEGASLNPANGNGSLDPSVAGGLLTGDPGGAHLRVQFLAAAVPGFVSAQQLTLIFGNDPARGHVTIGTAGGGTIPFTNASLTINVVPEPGTALLLGLGLAGLAGARRR